MQISSELKNIRTTSSEIINYIRRIKPDVDKNILFDIKLCAEEAMRNAIIHGNKSDRKLSVDIAYTIEKNRIKITVEDKGKGFDPSSIPDPTRPENLYKESGRGIHIMKRLMDGINYNKKGNRVTMEKELEEL